MKTLEDMLQDGVQMAEAMKGQRLFDKIKIIVKFIEENIETLVTEVDGLKNDGKTKKEIAVEILNEIFDVPFLGEKGEAMILGWLVNRAVKFFNKVGWKL